MKIFNSYWVYAGNYIYFKSVYQGQMNLEQQIFLWNLWSKWKYTFLSYVRLGAEKAVLFVFVLFF